MKRNGHALVPLPQPDLAQLARDVHELKSLMAGRLPAFRGSFGIVICSSRSPAFTIAR
jgi:hypothetical protein